MTRTNLAFVFAKILNCEVNSSDDKILQIEKLDGKLKN